MTGAADPRGVALRTSDPDLVDQVRRLTDLVGAELEVVVAGAPPPRAALLLDGATEAAPWVQRPGGPPVVRVHGTGPGRAGVTTPAGAAPAELHLPGQAEALLDLVATGHGRARVVGVLGATGGVGASVLATVLSRSAVTAGVATALVDLDPAGGGLDLMLGIEHDPGLRWADLTQEAGAFLPRLSLALPDWRGVRVLSGDLRGGSRFIDPVAGSALSALAQGHDLLVLDLPRGMLGHGCPPPAVLARCQHVVLVAGCDVRSAAAAVTAARLLSGSGIAAQLVVRRRGAGRAEAEELADQCSLPLAGVLREERSLRAGLERGFAPGDQRGGPVLALARHLVDLLELTS